MVVNSENIDPTGDTAANCLILLSRVGKSRVGDSAGGGGRALVENRVFQCKTCLKEFPTFQALGGHRASHTKPNNNEDPGSPKKKPLKATTSHICPICGLDFPMGQALGGHMRKHRNEKEKASRVLVTRSFLPEAPTLTNLKKSSSNGKNLALMESLVNTELELGRPFY